MRSRSEIAERMLRTVERQATDDLYSLLGRFEFRQGVVFDTLYSDLKKNLELLLMCSRGESDGGCSEHLKQFRDLDIAIDTALGIYVDTQAMSDENIDALVRIDYEWAMDELKEIRKETNL